MEKHDAQRSLRSSNQSEALGISHYGGGSGSGGDGAGAGAGAGGGGGGGDGDYR